MYVTYRDMSEDLQIEVKDLYEIARTLEGFYPKGHLETPRTKARRAQGLKPFSLFHVTQLRLLGRTFELAPGSTKEEKIQAIKEGFELSKKEKDLLYTPIALETKIETFAEKLNLIWEKVSEKVLPVPEPTTSFAVMQTLPSDYDTLTPEQCRMLAEQRRDVNAQKAFHLARKRDEGDVLAYFLQHALQYEAKTRLTRAQIIDAIKPFKAYLAAEFENRQSKSWRRFRQNLLASGRFTEPKSRGYFIVV